MEELHDILKKYTIWTAVRYQKDTWNNWFNFCVWEMKKKEKSIDEFWNSLVYRQNSHFMYKRKTLFFAPELKNWLIE